MLSFIPVELMLLKVPRFFLTQLEGEKEAHHGALMLYCFYLVNEFKNLLR